MRAKDPSDWLIARAIILQRAFEFTEYEFLSLIDYYNDNYCYFDEEDNGSERDRIITELIELGDVDIFVLQKVFYDKRQKEIGANKGGNIQKDNSV